MITIETWTCPQHGVVAKGVVMGKRSHSMIEAVSYHRIHDKCYAFFSIHSEDMEPEMLISENSHRQSEETQK